MARRALLALSLLLTLATCRDGSGPQLYYAPVAVAPIFPSEARLAAFGLSIDRVRFVVVRPVAPPDTLADTTVDLPSAAQTLDLNLRVPLVSSPETVLVSVVALAGAVPLFQGTAPVVVSSGVVREPTDIAVATYVGPGAGVDSIAISPRIPFIFFGDSLRFQVQAFQAGTPAPQFYVSWKTSDTALAHINGLGSLRAPASRRNVWVIARTPGTITDSVKATFQPIPTQLAVVAGAGQSGTVGLPLLLPLEVEVRAADNLPVGGVAVRFRSPSGIGAVTDSVAVTDTAGRARTTATLGSVIGPQIFEASVNGLTGSPATFGVTALAGTATQLLVVAGDGLFATVNTLLPTAPAVRLRDALGNPVAGVSVTFVPTGGGITGGNQITDATGLATVGSWTLGTIAGANKLTASGAGLTHVFNANGLAGPATALLTTAGNLQNALVGTVVAIDPAVRAEDQFGNPVPGASITFATKGGGKVAGPTQLTNGAGVATVGSWTLGTTAGTDTLTATLSGLTSVTFTATGLAGAATQIVRLAGDSQSAIVNTILPTAAAVIVRDQFNNPVRGVPVLFAPASGGGSVTGGSAATDTAGVARVASWRLGTLAGQNTLTATASGLTGSPVLFRASAIRDVAAQLLRFSIDTQTSIAGQPVSTPPAVRVVDQYGNPNPGASVTFALTGALLGSLTSSNATTDSSGVARVGTWTLATVAGLNTLDATALGLTGSPMTFSATGIITTATNMAPSAGDGQTGVVGAVLPTAYSVVVTNGITPVQGVPVHWAAGPTGGSMNPATSVTDVNGIASSSRTLGPAVGTQTATASVGGLIGSPVTFTATALAGAATQLLKQSADPQSGTVATAVTAPVVKVVDQFGNGVSGVIVDFAAAGGGVLGAIKDTSDAAGLATAGSWTLGTTAGSNVNSVQASTTGVPSVAFSATGIAGSPAQLAFLVPPSRSVAGDTMAPPVRVAVEDRYGNIDATAQDLVQLGFGKTAPFAKLLGTNPVAASNGIAVFPDLAIDSASDPLGPGYTLLATSGSLTGVESNAFDIGGVIKAFLSDRLQPVAAAYNPANGLVYVAGANNTLAALDPFTGPISLLPSLQGEPFGVAVNAKTNRVYVTTFGVLAGAMVVIDGSNNSSLPPFALADTARGITVDEATNRIFVAVAGDPLKLMLPALDVIDGRDNSLIASIPFPDGAAAGIGVAFNPKDRLVYVAIPNVGVGIFDPAGLKFVRSISIVGGKGAAGTFGVAVDTLTGLLYATNRADNSVSVIDLSSLKETRLRVGQLPEGLGVDAVRRAVYVGNSGDGTVSFIDAGNLGVFATLIVGPAPKAAAVNPGNGHFYVPTFGDDRVRVVQP